MYCYNASVTLLLQQTTPTHPPIGHTHHHTHLCLILEILPGLASGEVPDLHKAVSTACDKVLAIWGERGALRIRLAAKLDGLGENCGVLFILKVLYGGSTSAPRETKQS